MNSPDKYTAAFFAIFASFTSLFADESSARQQPALTAQATINETPIQEKYGSAAALQFARNYRGEVFKPNTLYCYPDALGVPFGDCENILPMTAVLWTPAQIQADFERRMNSLPANERKKGIIVVLKTERCAPKALRACTVTTAALEKRSTPLAAEFAIYGLLLKPRDKDNPAGSLIIETGLDAWKNDAAGVYDFKQDPGATLVFLNPADATTLNQTDAVALKLFEREFIKNAGATPTLHAVLEKVLVQIQTNVSNAPDPVLPPGFKTLMNH